MSRLVCAAVVMLLGVGGMMLGRTQVDRALAVVNPPDAEMIRAQGYKEANRPMQLAGGFVVLGACSASPASCAAKRAN